MKNCAFKTAVLALAFSVLSLFGCATVVTDVNAELAAIYPNEDLGIPVKLNENYIEVAYNPSAGAEDTFEEEESDKTEERTPENTEELSEDDTDEDTNAVIPSEDETDTEDTDEDGEDSDEELSEDADEEDESKESEDETDEEENDSDLNASMASDNFDAEFYAKAYPDVVAIFGDSPEALYKHYQDYGKAEGRSCNEEEFALLNEAVN